MESLKSLNVNTVGRAFEKAKHYRLLNDPENAESICLDILEVESNHQEALVVLILSIADQFDGGSKHVAKAREFLERLENKFHQSYYGGIIFERSARSILKRGKPRREACGLRPIQGSDAKL